MSSRKVKLKDVKTVIKSWKVSKMVKEIIDQSPARGPACCEVCGDHKYIARVKVCKDNGETAVWYLCKDCFYDVFGKPF